MDGESFFEELSKINNDLINERREGARLNIELAKNHRLLTRIFDLIPEAIYIYDIRNKRNDFSSREIAALVGYSPEEIKAMGPDFIPNLFNADDLAGLDGHWEEVAAARDGDIATFEYRMLDKEGAWRWILSRDSVFERDASGLPVKILGIATDITFGKAKELQLETESSIDELTGLNNRRAFLEEGKALVELSRRRSASCSVVFMDLDRFKEINDRFGHAAGDKALKAAADIMHSSFRSRDVLCRFGGDEFVALLPGAGAATTRIILSRLYAAFSLFNGRGETQWKLEVSAGYASLSEGGPYSLDSLIECADRAMYEAKALRHKD